MWKISSDTSCRPGSPRKTPSAFIICGVAPSTPRRASRSTSACARQTTSYCPCACIWFRWHPVRACCSSTKREASPLTRASGSCGESSSTRSCARKITSGAIWRELHDEVGQSLAALDLGLTRLGQSKKASDVQNQVEALSDIVRRLGEEVRRVARGLYPAALDDLGLGPALELLAEENSVALGVPVSIELDDLDGLPGDVALVVYRVVQEALANALRHATPGRVQLSVKREDERLKIEVDDDGRGFSPHQTQGRGLGLRGMRERIEELHGSFAVTSRPGDGTLVTASIPCPEVKP